ncbi:MAG: LacI family DNA-binding transcriptional regulator [Bacteroidota bacterium]
MSTSGITIKQIADMLNISSTTVSRVLNGRARQYRISERTEQLVREAAEKHHFQPNQIALNLRLNKTNTIGLVIPDISNPFFANLARTAETALRLRDKMILLCDTNDDTVREKESLQLLMGRKVDGLLVAPVGLSGSHFESFTHIPTVFIDRYFTELPIPFVATDNFQGAYEATEYLIKKGHRHITCIQGLELTVSNRERVKGFTEAMKDHGLPMLDDQVVGDDFSIANGHSAMLKLASKNRPTAIFALNNQIAIGAMQAIHELGLRIPQDVSIISFDEQPYFELTAPPVTTVRQPVAEIGEAAVQSLFDLMEGKNVVPKLLPPALIERKSVMGID